MRQNTFFRSALYGLLSNPIYIGEIRHKGVCHPGLHEPIVDRERFIGWSEPQRQKNLQLVVNNARFLILPWVQSKALVLSQ